MIAGFDEAGRGPLAGPVSAGCVILHSDFPFEILNDSKKLSEKKREAAYETIIQKSYWGVGLVEHFEIDKINILNASLLAMQRAFEDLQKRFPHVDVKNLEGIADGIYIPKVPFKCRPEVKADAKFPEVMAASIIAKVTRDRLMVEYDKLYPEYGYAKHKGYPTKAHKEVCLKIGPSPIQRLSFKI